MVLVIDATGVIRISRNNIAQWDDDDDDDDDDDVDARNKGWDDDDIAMVTTTTTTTLPWDDDVDARLSTNFWDNARNKIARMGRQRQRGFNVIFQLRLAPRTTSRRRRRRRRDVVWLGFRRQREFNVFPGQFGNMGHSQNVCAIGITLQKCMKHD